MAVVKLPWREMTKEESEADLATAAFVSDGGEPWQVAYEELRILGQPIDVVELVTEFAPTS